MSSIEVALLPGKGRGYKATTVIAAGTVIHTSEPLATTVSQEWIPETCLWCFNFTYPKKLKVKAMSIPEEKAIASQWKIPHKKNAGSLFKDVLFCSESCRDAFKAHDKNSSILASYYRLDQEYKASLGYETEMPIPNIDPQNMDNVTWLSVNDDEALSLWLNDAWDCLASNADLYRDIEDTDRTMCRLVAACIACHETSPEKFKQVLVIQNNELAHFRSHYNNSTLNPTRKHQLPLLKNSANKRELLLSYLPTEVFNVMALYSFIARALTNPLNQVPAITSINHHLFRSIYFREQSNSFGLWEMGDTDISLAEGGITDDLELLGWGIYPSAVYFNHSCDANVVKVREGRNMKFIARRMIEKDEEACISYGSVGEDVVSRRARLLSHYHFMCQCSRCIYEDAHYHSVVR